MTHRRKLILTIMVLLGIVALAFRLPQLDRRPMHGDEAVQASIFSELLVTHSYQYDPTEYHGPALHYATLPIAWIQGKTTLAALTETDLRLVPVLLGVATILLLFLLRDGLGTPVIILTALFAAISPALAYYNRYFIHESLLVFSTVATIATVWRYRQRPSLGWALAAGAAFGLLYATKTTWIIAVACGIVAWLLVELSKRLRPYPRTPRPANHPRPSPWHWLAGTLAALAIVVPLFTAFFTRPRGLVDSVRAFGCYFGRGLGTAINSDFHVHPWYYHLQNLLYVHTPRTPVWTHGFLVLLALVGGVAAFGRQIHGMRLGAVRFLTFFTILFWSFYSVIPYKTPWLTMSPLLSLLLLAGVGALVLWQYLSRTHHRLIFALILFAGMANLEWQSYCANFRFPSNPINPYVYAHTSADIYTLLDRLQSIAEVSPEHQRLRIGLCMADCWPLPWYLRGYPNVEFWTTVPASPVAEAMSILITAENLDPAADARLERTHMREYIGLRPNVHIFIHTRRDLWDKLLASRSTPPATAPATNPTKQMTWRDRIAPGH